MLVRLNHNRFTPISKAVCLWVAVSFAASLITPPQRVYAQSMAGVNLPVPGTMVSPSPVFVPALVKGISIHPENPLKFDFIIDTGHSKLEGEAFSQESIKLIKYFLATLTTPEKDLWVNLSPYEKDRIIPNEFGTTEMGRDLLSQDYILKQLTASLIYPEDEMGKEFWKKVYAQAQEQYGTTDIPVNTFNKVWIVPDEVMVYEKGTSAFIVKSRLKVMLEEDYTALRVNEGLGARVQGQGEKKQETRSKRQERNNSQTGKLDTPSEIRDMRYEIPSKPSSSSTEIMRELVIPEIEREVNEGKNFAQLRQIYNSMILAIWYKQNLRDSLLSKVYVDQKKVKGVDVEDKEVKQKIYEQYLEAFKRGVYNYIKEDYDPANKQLIPRKYFSGGFDFGRQLSEDVKKGTFGGDLSQLADEQRQATVEGSIPVGDQRKAEIIFAENAEEAAETASQVSATEQNEEDASMSTQLGVQSALMSTPLEPVNFSVTYRDVSLYFTFDAFIVQMIRAMNAVPETFVAEALAGLDRDKRINISDLSKLHNNQDAPIEMFSLVDPDIVNVISVDLLKRILFVNILTVLQGRLAAKADEPAAMPFDTNEVLRQSFTVEELVQIFIGFMKAQESASGELVKVVFSSSGIRLTSEQLAVLENFWSERAETLDFSSRKTMYELIAMSHHHLGKTDLRDADDDLLADLEVHAGRIENLWFQYYLKKSNLPLVRQVELLEEIVKLDPQSIKAGKELEKQRIHLAEITALIQHYREEGDTQVLQQTVRLLIQEDFHAAFNLFEVLVERPNLNLSEVNLMLVLLPNLKMMDYEWAMNFYRRLTARYRAQVLEKVLASRTFSHQERPVIEKIYRMMFEDHPDSRLIRLKKDLFNSDVKSFHSLERDFTNLKKNLHVVSVRFNYAFQQAQKSKGNVDIEQFHWKNGENSKPLSLKQFLNGIEDPARQLERVKEYFQAAYNLDLNVPFAEENNSLPVGGVQSAPIDLYFKREIPRLIRPLAVIDHALSLWSPQLILRSLSLQRLNVYKHLRAFYQHSAHLDRNDISIGLESPYLVQSLFHELGHSFYGAAPIFSTYIDPDRLQEVLDKHADFFREAQLEMSVLEANPAFFVWNMFQYIFERHMRDWKEFNSRLGIHDLDAPVKKRTFPMMEEYYGISVLRKEDRRMQPSLLLDYIFEFPAGESPDGKLERTEPYELIAEQGKLYGLFPWRLKAWDEVSFDLFKAFAGDVARFNQEILLLRGFDPINFDPEEEDASLVAESLPATVLVVDDDADQLDATVTLLGMKGFSVLQAKNGNEALNAVRDHPEIKVVLSDVDMPKMNGTMLAEELAVQAPEVQVILETARREDVNNIKEQAPNAIKVLLKPIDLNNLFEAIGAAMAVWGDEAMGVEGKNDPAMNVGIPEQVPQLFSKEFDIVVQELLAKLNKLLAEISTQNNLGMTTVLSKEEQREFLGIIKAFVAAEPSLYQQAYETAINQIGSPKGDWAQEKWIKFARALFFDLNRTFLISRGWLIDIGEEPDHVAGGVFWKVRRGKVEKFQLVEDDRPLIIAQVIDPKDFTGKPLFLETEIALFREPGYLLSDSAAYQILSEEYEELVSLGQNAGEDNLSLLSFFNQLNSISRDKYVATKLKMSLQTQMRHAEEFNLRANIEKKQGRVLTLQEHISLMFPKGSANPLEDIIRQHLSAQAQGWDEVYASLLTRVVYHAGAMLRDLMWADSSEEFLIALTDVFLAAISEADEQIYPARLILHIIEETLQGGLARIPAYEDIRDMENLPIIAPSSTAELWRTMRTLAGFAADAAMGVDPKSILLEYLRFNESDTRKLIPNQLRDWQMPRSLARKKEDLYGKVFKLAKNPLRNDHLPIDPIKKNSTEKLTDRALLVDPPISEPITFIPEGSRKIEQDGKILYISPKAQSEMKKLDEFTGAERDYAVEIAGFGLTKKFDDKTTVVVDFIVPDEQRIFAIDGLFINQYVDQLADALADAQSLKLTTVGDALIMLADEHRYVIDSLGWQSLHKYLQKLTQEALPEEYAQAKSFLAEKGEIPLNNYWQMVIAGGLVRLTRYYYGNVIAEAYRQKALPNYTMHHHPQLGLAVAVLADKSLAEREEYYQKLLRFSHGDADYMNQHDIEWFEIRALGTLRDMRLSETTQRFYNMQEINKVAEGIKFIIDRIESLDSDSQPIQLAELVAELAPYFQTAADKDWNLKELLRYAIGKERFQQYEDRLRKRIDSVKDLVLDFVLLREDVLEHINKLTAELLRVYQETALFKVYSQVMDFYSLNNQSAELINRTISQKELWNITGETDIQRLRKGAADLQVLLLELQDTAEDPAMIIGNTPKDLEYLRIAEVMFYFLERLTEKILGKGSLPEAERLLHQNLETSGTPESGDTITLLYREQPIFFVTQRIIPGEGLGIAMLKQQVVVKAVELHFPGIELTLNDNQTVVLNLEGERFVIKASTDNLIEASFKVTRMKAAEKDHKLTPLRNLEPLGEGFYMIRYPYNKEIGKTPIIIQYRRSPHLELSFEGKPATWTVASLLVEGNQNRTSIEEVLRLADVPEFLKIYQENLKETKALKLFSAPANRNQKIMTRIAEEMVIDLGWPTEDRRLIELYLKGRESPEFVLKKISAPLETEGRRGDKRLLVAATLLAGWIAANENLLSPVRKILTDYIAGKIDSAQTVFLLKSHNYPFNRIMRILDNVDILMGQEMEPRILGNPLFPGPNHSNLEEVMDLLIFAHPVLFNHYNEIMTYLKNQNSLPTAVKALVDKGFKGNLNDLANGLIAARVAAKYGENSGELEIILRAVEVELGVSEASIQYLQRSLSWPVEKSRLVMKEAHQLKDLYSTIKEATAAEDPAMSAQSSVVRLDTEFADEGLPEDAMTNEDIFALLSGLGNITDTGGAFLGLGSFHNLDIALDRRADMIILVNRAEALVSLNVALLQLIEKTKSFTDLLPAVKKLLIKSYPHNFAHRGFEKYVDQNNPYSYGRTPLIWARDEDVFRRLQQLIKSGRVIVAHADVLDGNSMKEIAAVVSKSAIPLKWVNISNLESSRSFGISMEERQKIPYLVPALESVGATESTHIISSFFVTQLFSVRQGSLYAKFLLPVQAEETNESAKYIKFALRTLKDLKEGGSLVPHEVRVRGHVLSIPPRFESALIRLEEGTIVNMNFVADFVVRRKGGVIHKGEENLLENLRRLGVTVEDEVEFIGVEDMIHSGQKEDASMTVSAQETFQNIVVVSGGQTEFMERRLRSFLNSPYFRISVIEATSLAAYSPSSHDLVVIDASAFENSEEILSSIKLLQKQLSGQQIVILSNDDVQLNQLPPDIKLFEGIAPLAEELMRSAYWALTSAQLSGSQDEEEEVLGFVGEVDQRVRNEQPELLTLLHERGQNLLALLRSHEAAVKETLRDFAEINNESEEEAEGRLEERWQEFLDQAEEPENYFELVRYGINPKVDAYSPFALERHGILNTDFIQHLQKEEDRLQASGLIEEYLFRVMLLKLKFENLDASLAEELINNMVFEREVFHPRFRPKIVFMEVRESFIPPEISTEEETEDTASDTRFPRLVPQLKEEGDPAMLVDPKDLLIDYLAEQRVTRREILQKPAAPSAIELSQRVAKLLYKKILHSAVGDDQKRQSVSPKPQRQTKQAADQATVVEEGGRNQDEMMKVEELQIKFITLGEQEKLEFLIDHFLTHGKWFDFESYKWYEREEFLGNENLLSVLWWSRLTLFQLLRQLNDQGKKEIIGQGQLYAAQKGPDYKRAFDFLLNSKWEEWQRRMHIKELENLEQWGSLFNFADNAIFTVTDRDSKPGHFNVNSRQIKGDKLLRQFFDFTQSVTLVFRVPSFFTEGLGPATKLFFNSRWLPHRGGEWIPEEYPEPWKTNLEKNKDKDGIGVMEADYLDIEASLAAQRLLLEQGEISREFFAEVERLLNNIKIKMENQKYKMFWGTSPTVDQSSGSVDESKNTSTGGMDFTQLQIKRDGNGVALPVSDQPLGEINLEGLLPVIINVAPVSIPLLLGVADEVEEKKLAMQDAS